MIKQQIVALGLALSGLFGLAPKVLAADPAMDAGVQTAVQSAVSGMQSAALTNFSTLIPVAAVLFLTVAVVYFVIRHFRAIAHV